MKRQRVKQFLIKLLRLFPALVCAGLVALCLLYRDRISIDAILGYTPDNQFCAAAMLVIMYAVKSLAVFFPLIVLNIVGGMIFSPAAALLVNTLGVAVMTALPYCIGRFCGAEYLEKLEKRYPKIAYYVDKQKGNEFFISFFLRIISCLPGDIVSLYFGAAKIPFGVYFAGSMLGIIPGVITATFMGTSILQPGSATFIISLSLTVALSLLSLIIHRLYEKKRQK